MCWQRCHFIVRKAFVMNGNIWPPIILIDCCVRYFFIFLLAVWNWSISRNSKIPQKHWPLPQQQSRAKFRKRWKRHWRNWFRKMFNPSWWWPMPSWAMRSKRNWTCNACPAAKYKSFWDAFGRRAIVCWPVCQRKRWPPWLLVWPIRCHATSWNSRQTKLIRWLCRHNAFSTIWTKNWTTIWWEPVNGE